MKQKTGMLAVLVAGLGLVGVFGCDDTSHKPVGPVTVPEGTPKTSEEAAKQLAKQQAGMYGGSKAGSPPGTGSRGGGMTGPRPTTGTP